MKRIILLIAATYLLLSCTREETLPKQPKWQEVAIGANVLPLALRIPENEALTISSRWNETFGRLELIGQENDMVFIQESETTCLEKQNELDAGIFNVSYVEQSDSLLVYKTSVPGGKESYWNVFASIKIGDTRYVIEQNPLIAYNREDIIRITDIIKRIKAN